MDLKRLTDKAKDLVENRGGTESVKEDAAELKDIASGKGSLTDKAKAAVAAIKDPGDDSVDATPAPPPTEAPAAEAAPTEAERGGKRGRAERGNRGRGGHGRGGRGHGRGGGRDGDPAV